MASASGVVGQPDQDPGRQRQRPFEVAALLEAGRLREQSRGFLVLLGHDPQLVVLAPRPIAHLEDALVVDGHVGGAAHGLVGLVLLRPLLPQDVLMLLDEEVEAVHGFARLVLEPGEALVERLPDALQVLHQVVRVLVALRGVLGQAPLDDRGQLRGKGGLELVHGLGILLEDLEQGRVEGRGAEGLAAGQKLVAEGARGKEVGAVVDLVTPHLLRRHVVGGAEHGAGLRDVRGGHVGEAEVEDLHRARGGDVDVAGLDVAVDDLLVVGVGQAFGDLRQHPEPVFEGQALAAGDPGLQVFALDVLHHHVGAPILLPELEDRDDVLVGELPRGARLAEEPGPHLGRGVEVGRHGLDGHDALHQRIAGPVDHPHGPLADLLQDLVLADLGLRVLFGRSQASEPPRGRSGSRESPSRDRRDGTIPGLASGLYHRPRTPFKAIPGPQDGRLDGRTAPLGSNRLDEPAPAPLPEPKALPVGFHGFPAGAVRA